MAELELQGLRQTYANGVTAVVGGEVAGCIANWFHEGLPVSAGGMRFGAGVACDQFGGFGRADGIAGVSFGEEG